jgi:hypothetical protein
MVDLRERMKEVEQNDSLDLWDEITARTPSYDDRVAPLRSRVAAGVVAAAVAIAGLTLLFASFGPPSTDVTSAAPTRDAARVDLVEAGIRAVAHPADVLFIETSLCRPDPGQDCPAPPLTDEEQRTLADRLRDLGGIRFVPSGADIPAGESPDALPGREFIFLGIPQDQGDGTFWIEANVICKGACGRGGGTYIVRNQNGVWTSMGRAPGTPTWGP